MQIIDAARSGAAHPRLPLLLCGLIPAVIAGVSAATATDVRAVAPPASCRPGASTVEVAGASACVEEVEFTSEALTLAGQWFTPRGGGPFPAVVVIRGSGPSSRGNPWTESLAAVLLTEGVGVLLPDKRGSGRSEGDWRTADFHELAGDALAAVRFLTARPEVAPDLVGVMGLSQGGQIAPMAAARTDSVAFVINVVGAAVPFLDNVRYEMRHTFEEEGLSGARLDAAMAMVDTAAGYVSGSVSWDAYATALRETRNVIGNDVADEYFIDSPGHWRWDFFRRLVDFDPVVWWRRVRQPTLVLFGEADANTPTTESAGRLRAAFDGSGRPDATVVVFEGLGHALWDHGGAVSGHGLHADVRRTLRSWIRRVALEGQ